MTATQVDHIERITDEIKANVDAMLDENLRQVFVDLNTARKESPSEEIPVKISFSVSKKQNVIILKGGVKIAWGYNMKRSDSTDEIQIDLDQKELALEDEAE